MGAIIIYFYEHFLLSLHTSDSINKAETAVSTKTWSFNSQQTTEMRYPVVL